MARSTAADKYRETHERKQISVELTKDDHAIWKAYANSKGLPMGTMIRYAVAMAMQTDEWDSMQKKE